MERSLATYLQDHLAGATFGVELVRRTRANNEGTSFAPALADLVREIESDKETLRSLMERLRVSPSKVKDAAAWTAEKALRARPSAGITAYSPLGRVTQLETLASGIAAKRALWRALQQVAAARPELAEFDLPVLEERAQTQLAAVEELRLQAVRIAFLPGQVEPTASAAARSEPPRT